MANWLTRMLPSWTRRTAEGAYRPGPYLLSDGWLSATAGRYPFDQASAIDVNVADFQRLFGPGGLIDAFTTEVLQTMAALNAQPIVFALSNPTSKAECTAEEAYQATEGRALFACGSPFAPVQWGDKTLVPRQGNNSYIFPGLGLGAIACGARHITDEMFLAAAQTLAAYVTPEDLQQGSLLPPLTSVREVSVHIAVAVAEVIFERGLATRSRPESLLDLVRGHVYDPRYTSYV